MMIECTRRGLFEGLYTTLDGHEDHIGLGSPKATSTDAFALWIYCIRMAISQVASGIPAGYQAMSGEEVRYFQIIRISMHKYLGTAVNSNWRHCHYLSTLPLGEVENEVSTARSAIKNLRL